MNIFKIIDDIEKVDPEVYERLKTRRGIFSQLGSMSKKAALAAIPFAFASGIQKAYGKSNDAVTDILNYALKLEYLEAEFYQMGNQKTGLIPASDQAIFTQIGKHENAHVALLVAALGSAANPKEEMDFENVFPDVFTNYQTFLTVAQVFEDTGVRAYKGQAGGLLNTPVLTTALQIHSVEARHASMVRILRGQKGWITGNDAGGSGVQASYAGEENTTQGGLTRDKYTSLVDAKASEAFDEPLTMDQVNNIVSPFFVR